jgi:hypothetical protein
MFEVVISDNLSIKKLFFYAFLFFQVGTFMAILTYVKIVLDFLLFKNAYLSCFSALSNVRIIL